MQIQDGSAVFMVRDKRMKSMIDFFYPIGSVYMSADKSKTKADFPFMAYGTWEEVPANLCLQVGTASEAGTQRSAGLPNITGTISGGIWRDFANNNGAFAFKEEHRDSGLTGANGYSNYFIEFDASKSNSIYGSSNTVQPPAYMVRAWVRTA